MPRPRVFEFAGRTHTTRRVNVHALASTSCKHGANKPRTMRADAKPRLFGKNYSSDGSRSAFLLRLCHYSQSPCQLPTGTRLQQPHGVGGWRGCARSRRVALVPPGVHVKRGRTLEVSARRALRTRRCAAGAGALVDRAAVVVNATAYRIPWSDIRVSRGRMCGVRIRYCHLRHINARA